MPATRNDIVNFVTRTLLRCSRDFERTANAGGTDGLWCSDRMPESWILVALMCAAAKRGLSAFPEARASHDFEFCKSEGNTSWASGEVAEELKRRKIDLLLGEASSVGPKTKKMRVQAALELKGPKSDWDSFTKDANRLRKLAPFFRNKNQVRILGYVSPPLSDEKMEREKKEFKKRCDGPKEGENICVLPASPSRPIRNEAHGTSQEGSPGKCYVFLLTI